MNLGCQAGLPTAGAGSQGLGLGSALLFSSQVTWARHFPL